MDSLAEQVRAAAAAWRWVPYDAVRVSTPAVELVISGDDARVHRAQGALAAPLVARARELATSHGAASLTWVVTDGGGPAGLAETLAAHGATVAEDLAVMGRPVGGGEVASPAVEVRRVDTPELLDQAYAIEQAVLATPARSARFRQAAVAALAEQVAAGPARRSYRFVALAGGAVVATAGLTLAGATARLWSAAVLPGHRGQGIYRALLAARLAEAGGRATLALAKARTGTAEPILRRAGFHTCGREWRHRLRLSGPGRRA